MEPIQPDSLNFSSSSYVFSTFTNQTGLLGIVNAFSRRKNVSIHYMLQVQDGKSRPSIPNHNNLNKST